MTIDRVSVAVDLFNNIGNGARPRVGYGCVARGTVDGAYGLGAEHERIVPHALAVDLGFESEIAQPIEACLRLFLDAAIEKVHRCEIARVLDRTAQSERVAGAAVVVFRCPGIPAPANGWERDLVVLDKGVGLQPLAERGE